MPRSRRARPAGDRPARADSATEEALDHLDQEHGTAGNRLFYLATPPSFFPVIVKHLGAAGLAKPKQPGKTWTRIILEKPFGRSLESARELNQTVTGIFDEEQVYRIDHYLGKETVQNLLVFRYANGITVEFKNRRYNDAGALLLATKARSRSSADALPPYIKWFWQSIPSAS